jgi:hypothetical protein
MHHRFCLWMFSRTWIHGLWYAFQIALSCSGMKSNGDCSAIWNGWILQILWMMHRGQIENQGMRFYNLSYTNCIHLDFRCWASNPQGRWPF